MESQPVLEQQNSLAIQGLLLDNFMTFKTARVAFEPGYNVIVGFNGSGKTSLFHALQFECFYQRHLSFLVTEFGKPLTVNGFGNWFSKRCNEAGLPRCTAYGLRKEGTSIAAENGATERKVMAIFGWSTMKEVVHYTKAARQRVLADSGIKLNSLDRNQNKGSHFFGSVV